MEKFAGKSEDTVTKSPKKVAKLSKSEQPSKDEVIGEVVQEKPKAGRRPKATEAAQSEPTGEAVGVTSADATKKAPTKRALKSKAVKVPKLSNEEIDALTKEYNKLAYVKLKKLLRDKKLNPANREIATNIFNTYSFNGSRLKVGDKVISMYGKRLRDSVIEDILPASAGKRIKVKGIQKPFDARHIVK